MKNESEIIEILAMLNAAYPKYELTEETIGVYIRLLKDLPSDELKLSAIHCATSGKFFPSVNELRSGVVELKKKSAGIPSPYEAWGEVMDNPTDRKFIPDDEGEYRWSYSVFTHPLIEKVARELGWPRKFPGKNGSQMADRSHFVKAYEIALEEVIDYEIMLPEVREFIKTHHYHELGSGEEYEQEGSE